MEKEHGDRKRYYCFNFNIDESSGESLADQFCLQVEEEFAEFIKNPAYSAGFFIGYNVVTKPEHADLLENCSGVADNWLR